MAGPGIRLRDTPNYFCKLFLTILGQEVVMVRQNAGSPPVLFPRILEVIVVKAGSCWTADPRSLEQRR
jgi:hypothetical protein